MCTGHGQAIQAAEVAAVAAGAAVDAGTAAEEQAASAAAAKAAAEKLAADAAAAAEEAAAEARAANAAARAEEEAAAEHEAAVRAADSAFAGAAGMAAAKENAEIAAAKAAEDAAAAEAAAAQEAEAAAAKALEAAKAHLRLPCLDRSFCCWVCSFSKLPLSFPSLQHERGSAFAAFQNPALVFACSSCPMLIGCFAGGTGMTWRLPALVFHYSGRHGARPLENDSRTFVEPCRGSWRGTFAGPWTLRGTFVGTLRDLGPFAGPFGDLRGTSWLDLAGPSRGFCGIFDFWRGLARDLSRDLRGTFAGPLWLTFRGTFAGPRAWLEL